MGLGVIKSIYSKTKIKEVASNNYFLTYQQGHFIREGKKVHSPSGADELIKRSKYREGLK